LQWLGAPAADLRDSALRTPEDLARARGFGDVVRFIQEHKSMGRPLTGSLVLHLAASRIQAFWRGFMVRRMLRMRKSKQSDALLEELVGIMEQSVLRRQLELASEEQARHLRSMSVSSSSSSLESLSSIGGESSLTDHSLSSSSVRSHFSAQCAREDAAMQSSHADSVGVKRALCQVVDAACQCDEVVVMCDFGCTTEAASVQVEVSRVGEDKAVERLRQELEELRTIVESERSMRLFMQNKAAEALMTAEGLRAEVARMKSRSRDVPSAEKLTGSPQNRESRANAPKDTAHVRQSSIDTELPDVSPVNGEMDFEQEPFWTSQRRMRLLKGLASKKIEDHTRSRRKV
jgi:hypothetical protein